MMAHTGRGGSRPGAGRPPGSTNRPRTLKNQAHRDALAVLAEIATDKAEPATVRLQAAQIILTHGAASQEEPAHA